ncbi:MAG: TolC family outer membrane protein [Luteibacter sp.]
MRLKSLIVALAMVAAPLASPAEDLLDAYRQARANDPVLSQADASRLATHEDVAQTRALLLPQVDARLSMDQSDAAGPTRTPIYGADGTGVVGYSGDTGHTRTRELGATVSQSIVDIGRYTDLEAARSLADSQDATYEAALQRLYTRVATAYFQVLTDEDALTFAKANEQALGRELDREQHRFGVGLVTITDVQDTKASHDGAVASVITAENSLADSREALTQITGQPADHLKKLRETLPMDLPMPNEARAWVAEAVRMNPTLIAAQYNVDSAEHSIGSARAGHLPTVDASLGYSKSAAWNQNAVGGTASGTQSSSHPGVTSANLTLNVPVFSGGATQSRVRQSTYQRDAAEDALEITRREVVRDTLNYFRSVVAGVSKVAATRAAVDSAEIARDASQAGVVVGTRTIVDVLLAQQSVTSALSDYSQARHAFVLDKLLLEQAAGTIGVKDLEAVNSLLD